MPTRLVRNVLTRSPVLSFASIDTDVGMKFALYSCECDLRYIDTDVGMKFALYSCTAVNAI